MDVYFGSGCLQWRKINIERFNCFMIAWCIFILKSNNLKKQTIHFFFTFMPSQVFFHDYYYILYINICNSLFHKRL